MKKDYKREKSENATKEKNHEMNKFIEKGSDKHGKRNELQKIYTHITTFLVTNAKSTT